AALCALGLGAAQHRAHPREELAVAEGLGDVVVGAELEAHHAVDLFLAPGEDDDREVQGFAQPARDREPVLVRELEVEDHEVDHLGAEDLVHVGAGFRHRDLEVVLGEVLMDDVADGGVVVDDEDVGFQEGAGVVVWGILARETVESQEDVRRALSAGGAPVSARTPAIAALPRAAPVRQTLAYVAFGVVYYLIAAYAAHLPVHAELPLFIWPAHGAALGTLLVAAPRRWAGYLAIVFVASVAV